VVAGIVRMDIIKKQDRLIVEKNPDPGFNAFTIRLKYRYLDEL